MTPLLRISAQAKIGWGAALVAVALLLMILSPLAGLVSFPSPWDFVAGFATGLVAGLGATLAVAGLIERRG